MNLLNYKRKVVFTIFLIIIIFSSSTILLGDENNTLITVNPINCDSCTKPTTTFYNKTGEWWDEFLEDDEKICLDCMKDRPGFREKWDEMIGIPIERYQEL